ncbi:amidase [Bradyrhizobium sp. NAS80.1]|uniref:amidase n=1 Tax=Bradyrhizobium sp. NAS80.1 TaxID=1680159 RepID=UPI00095DE09E|nr:amidase [Bradyrhizobium sp. NAS80.1]OKO89238.1 amidase [Bradyrhizobium sp. NAS80.1]
MTVRVPTPAALRDTAADLGLSLSESDVQSFIGLMKGHIDAYNVVDALPDYLPEIKYPRTPGRLPSTEENRHNAWYVKTDIHGAPRGLLSGKSVAIKDNVMVAGVPMMNGASILEGYVPDIDATLVTRLLDAGARIAGKSHCEYYCLTGNSHTGSKGPVHNPHRMGYSAGGSSSGSAVVVALGEVDMAIGGDQGGSIRMPAAYSGVVGLKPTFGLVPYTGIMPIEPTVDHAGPMTRTVRDAALMLQVIAGPDGFDARQDVGRSVPAYSEQLDGGVEGMKIAVVTEGFGWPNSEPDVDQRVRNAAELFQSLGATVREVSIPMHRLGISLWGPIAIDGLTHTMMWGDAYGASRNDLYVTGLMDHQRRWRERADELSESTKLFTLVGTYVRRRHGLRYYGKAMNLMRQLRAAYDAVLAKYDLLLMPTVPLKATRLPAVDASREEYMQRAHEMLGNCAPFNSTHHPSISLPCGFSDGLPVGLMLSGRHWDEATLLRAAHSFEQAGGFEFGQSSGGRKRKETI